jgi:hypothetical protein
MCDCKEKMKKIVIPIALIIYIGLMFIDFNVPVIGKDYQSALVYCSHYKKMETQNNCRARATKKFLGETDGQKKKDCD